MDAKVLIAMPVRKDYLSDIRSVQWCDRQVAIHPKGEVEFLWIPSEACERGRNNAIEVANRMTWPWTHILTMDDDVVPQPDMIDRLLAWDKDIVAGCYPIQPGGIDMWSFKLAGAEWWWHGENPDEPGGDPPIELAKRPGYPLLHAEVLAGGVVLSRRKVFDAIGWPWSKTEYVPMNDRGETCGVSEDVFFCNRAKQCGFDIWVDVSCTSDHYNRVGLGNPSKKRKTCRPS